MSERIKLSATNCRTICTRLAPTASRTANSRVRAAERASNRLATFAHEISRTSPAAPSSNISVPPTSPTRNFFNGSTYPPKPRSVVGLS